MKKIIITQSNYIPWKGYFDGINMVDEFIIYDDMQYTKRDWRNRNMIKTKDGLKWLSIPVEVKGKFFQKINETKVSDKNWAQNHWAVIHQNYSKAPYFKLYRDVFEGFYKDCEKEQYLSKINYLFLKGICELLDIKTKISWSNDFILTEGKTERLVDLCQQINATDYYSGPAAKEYMDESLFEKENIKVHYFDYNNYPEYPQQFDSFEHGVTILDLLFNMGNESKNYMKSFSHEK
ncbi:WbqC family protein [uncultured Chryseobacterium sp.]|uniref:WbqC family protein n=1 Tax=uncultured Chryseobacterium sp. TaxID=259322 RepID=UPI0025CC0AAC|nr:WbqC family protein [uncultured Chryseobacterium sp.]